MIAKSLRMRRIINPTSGRLVALPIDHGLTMGPIPGLQSTSQLAGWLPEAEIDALILHKGMLERLVDRDLLGNFGLLLHINGMPNSCPDADSKELLSSVTHAHALGVDGVSLQLNFTGENDRTNWRTLGAVTDRAQRLGLPVLLMLYDKTPAATNDALIFKIRQRLRSCIELGVDIVKIGMPEQPNLLRPLLADIREDLRVVVAGGDLGDSTTFLRGIRAALESGAAGLCVGRNVFSRQDPATWTRVLSQIVHHEEQGDVQAEVSHGRI